MLKGGARSISIAIRPDFHLSWESDIGGLCYYANPRIRESNDVQMVEMMFEEMINSQVPMRVVLANSRSWGIKDEQQ